MSDIEGKRDKRNCLKNRLNEAYREEEIYWCQKARMRWLKEGDKNTRFFHASVEGRRRRNRMMDILQEDGTGTKNENELSAEIASYYRELFKTSEARDIEEVLNGIPHDLR